MFAKCPTCKREFKVNHDGTIRRHWCHPETGSSKEIQLSTGGTLTLRLTANWMLFKEPERRLLDTLSEAIMEYEAANVRLQANGRHALQGACAGDVPERAPVESGDDTRHDGAGQRTPQTALEVQSVPSSVSAQAVCPENGEDTR